MRASDEFGGRPAGSEPRSQGRRSDDAAGVRAAVSGEPGGALWPAAARLARVVPAAGGANGAAGPLSGRGDGASGRGDTDGGAVGRAGGEGGGAGSGSALGFDREVAAD